MPKIPPPRVIECDRLGLKVLYAPPNAADIDVDIIAVHGLGANTDWSWTYKAKSPGEQGPAKPSASASAETSTPGTQGSTETPTTGSTETPTPGSAETSTPGPVITSIPRPAETSTSEPAPVNWLSDPNMLPQATPNSRIMTFSYDSIWYGEAPVNQELSNIAHSLLRSIMVERKECETRPLIFIGHCFGGLVMQKAYLDSTLDNVQYPSIAAYVAGMIFMGTPHRGTGGALHTQGMIYKAIAAQYRTEAAILQMLIPDNAMLKDVVKNFTTQVGRPVRPVNIFCFYEQRLTEVGVIIRNVLIKEYVVNQDSATLDTYSRLGLPLDHFNLNKFRGPNDGNYIHVRNEVVSMVERAIRDPPGKPPVDTNNPFAIGFSLSEVTEVEHFVAREKELSEIHNALAPALDEGGGRRTVTVQALGGMGKTQLAVAYAKRHRQTYSAVFWLNARDEMTLKVGYLRLAKQILCQHPSVDYVVDAVKSRKRTKHDEIVTAVNRWLDQLGNSRWLVIYDNYDTPALDENTDERQAKQRGAGLNMEDGDLARASRPYDIRPFLPTIHQGSILITTRSPKVEMGHTMPLGRMSALVDSLKILASASGRRDLDRDTGAIALVEALGGLPLALSTAGAFLNGSGTHFAEYLTHYSNSWLLLQQTTPVPHQDQALHLTWNMSFEQIRIHNSNAANLLRLWAYFDNQDLWFGLLRAGHRTGPNWFGDLTHNVLQFHDAIRILCKYGLAEPNTASDKDGMELQGYSMHACVHMWAVHVLNKRQDAEIARLAIQCVATMKPDCSNLTGRLARHADRCLAMEKGNKALRLRSGDEWILQNLGDLYTEDSQFENAEAMYKRTLRRRETSRGPVDHLTLETATKLGILYMYFMYWKDAMALFDRVLQAREMALGLGHPLTLEIARYLGIVNEQLGNHTEAEDMYNQALDGYENLLTPLPEPTLDTMINLADFYMTVGRNEECEQLYMDALEGYEESLGARAIETLDTAYKLGILYRNLERFAEATNKLGQALQGYEITLGPNGVSALDPVEELEPDELSVIYEDNGPKGAATIMYETLVRGYAKVLGPGHSATLDAGNILGILLASQRRVDSAEATAIYERGLLTCGAVLGEQHPLVLEVRKNLSELHNMGRNDYGIGYDHTPQYRENLVGPVVGMVGNLSIAPAECQIGDKRHPHLGHASTVGTMENSRTRGRDEDGGDYSSERAVKRARMD